MQQTEGMVKNLIKKFQEQGLDVLYAKCDGYAEPEKVQGVKPDVVSWDPNKEIYHLGMIADSETVSSDLGQERIAILANMMMGVGNSEGKRLPFYLGVPKDEQKTTFEKLGDHNVLSQDNFQAIEV